MTINRPCWVFIWLAWFAPWPAAAADVDYLREIKPVLARHCYRCHGPLKQSSGLRLDTVALMLRGGENGPALVAGKSQESRLIQAIQGANGWKMPPEGDALNAAEVARLAAWIDGGAVAPEETAVDPAKHWAFQRPVRPPLPVSPGPEGMRHPIDAFLSVERAARKLNPQPPAAKAVLLRRVSLDLIGLPPTREEYQQFLADESPDAYERLIERLLASPQYGERWGRHWLDVWRYSDWYGFQQEVRFSHQHLWRWRDWVVDSLNADLGYDRMIVNMLAADEQHPFHVDDLPATGFLVRNRNTDSRESWISDAVEHTAKAFLGLTLACARCHDHMTDPIPQTDYYRFRAILEPHEARIDELPGIGGVARVIEPNLNVPTYLFVRGNDRDPDQSSSIPPGIPAIIGGTWHEPSPRELSPLSRVPGLRVDVQEATRKHHAAQVASAKAEFEQVQRTVQRLAAPETAIAAAEDVTQRITPIRDENFLTDLDLKAWKLGPGTWQVKAGVLRQEVSGGSDTKWIRTRAPHPRNLAVELNFKIVEGVRYRSVGMRFDAGDTHGQGVYVTANEAAPALAFYVDSGGNRQYLDKLRKPQPLSLQQEISLRVEVRDQLVNVFVNGQLAQVYRLAEERRDGWLEIQTTDAVVEISRIRLSALNDTAILQESAPCGTLPDPATPEGRGQLQQRAGQSLTLATRQLAARQAEQHAYLATEAAERWKFLKPPPPDSAADVKASYQAQLQSLSAAATTAQRTAGAATAQFELATAEDALVRMRHCSDPAKDAAALMEAEKKVTQARDKLAAAEKAANQPESVAYVEFSAVAGNTTGRRSALAAWIAAEQNPLTARVAVNHIWLRHFGQPLVATVFDFGLSGQPPTHPELLEWLAVEFMQPSFHLRSTSNGSQWEPMDGSAPPWSMKHLHRLIVTSRAYRCRSDGDAEAAQLDPGNHFYWRFLPRRLEAEAVRDSVLAVCGQLDPMRGGPELPETEGLRTPRRSLYFRTNPDRQMEFLSAFDAASPVECYQRNTSVVPQQSLALANSELTLINSRRLAGRLIKTQPEARSFVTAAFEHILSRTPSASETALSMDYLRRQEDRARQNTAAIDALSDEQESAEGPARDPVLRARELLVHALLNHSDFVTIR